MKKLAIVLLFPLLAACDADMEDEEMVLETDMSEANMSTDCPVDVSEADRANYPACN
jgi:nitrous oxide reductase accessory protein NosL